MEHQKISTHDRELLITRTIDAPVELVWEVWTKPEHIAQWWGPNDFTTTINTMELETGGKWEIVMHGPDGTDYVNVSTFGEIIPFKRFAYNHTSYPHIIATIDFEDLGGQTLIKWHMLFDSAEELAEVAKKYKVAEGQKQNVEKLAAYLHNLAGKKA